MKIPWNGNGRLGRTNLDAIKYADKKADRWNLPELVLAGVEEVPVDTVNWLEKKINELLLEGRGRSFYARIASTLQIAIEKGANRKTVEGCAQRLFLKFSHLRALKDELSQAGFRP